MANVHDHAIQGSKETDKKDHSHGGTEEVENAGLPVQNSTTDDDTEPELHARTWIALAAFFLLNHTQVVALQGPAAVLNFIGADLHNNAAQTWVVTVLSLVQGVLGPIISTASDTFQARKLLLVGSCAISFIGACIAPGSTSIYRLIGANILISVGFASVPLAYAVPSEILPRKWRPMAQAGVSIAALLASVTGPFIIGSLTKRDPHTGWRMFYWFQAALWGATTIILFVCYRPPKRHTGLEDLSFWAKAGKLDLVGCGLLTAGLALFLTGTGLGGGLYSWADPRTLSTMAIGLVTLVAFGVHQWKGTKTGILHHDLFAGGRNKGRTFAICVGLLFVEAAMGFAFAIFYPILTETLFTTDPVLIVARSQACWIPAICSTFIWGYASTRFQTIREPLLIGFVFFTAGLVGLATIQPGQSVNAIAFACLAGIGVGAPLILVVTGVQLSTPHRLIATATACTTSSRAIAGAIFSAIDAAAFNSRIKNYLVDYVANAASAAGLPASSLAGFITALTEGDTAALVTVPGVTPTIIEQGVSALQQAYADSIRIVFVIAVPFGAAACIACWFLGDLRDTMNYRVDAPVENLHKGDSEDGGYV
ncbi:putative siderophore iron transporter [Thozetella sp. PMI_491]|nr:putative siderophore iron transporter [Thozetella sp. PMI_491]